MENAVSLRNLSKVFLGRRYKREKHVAVDDVTLDVKRGELLAIVGPRGCGKSTILNMIAGLEKPSSGKIYVDGERIDNLPPRARNTGYMLQGNALFSHSNVFDNISFGLKLRKMPKRERQQRVEEIMSLIGLEGLESRKPHQLSEVEQQRVALARALAPEPRVLLLDEPFSRLGPKSRQSFKANIKTWQRQMKIATILVTSHQSDALELGDRVAILNAGRFEQVDTSDNISNYPASPFVASFIGNANRGNSNGGNANGYADRQDGGRADAAGIYELDISGRLLDPDGGFQPLDGDEPQRSTTTLSFLRYPVLLDLDLKNVKASRVLLPGLDASNHELNPGGHGVTSFEALKMFSSGPVELRRTKRSNADSAISANGQSES